MAMYKRFPPRTGHLLVPVRTRRSALAGISMYAPTKWTGTLVQRAAWVAAWVAGPRALPFRSISEGLEAVDEATWHALLSDWEARLGRFEDVAIYRPPDSHRPGVAALLLNRGSPVGFVKARPSALADSLVNEEQALKRMARLRSTNFFVNAPLASGQVGDWHYLATEPLNGRVHRAPHRPPISMIVDDIQEGLAQMPRRVDVPAHWQPIHGDFSPWNLRRTTSGRLVLFDWEAAGWGPPGSDTVMYVSTSAAVGRRPDPRYNIGGKDLAEARTFWRDYWRHRIELYGHGSPDPGALAVQVLRVLDAVEEGTGGRGFMS